MSKSGEKRTPYTPGERVPYYRRLGFYIPLIFIGGIALAVLLFAQGMFQLGWKEHPPPAALKNPFLSVFVSPDAPEVILYASPTATAFLSEVGGNPELLFKQWRTFFEKSARPYREIRDPQELAQAGTAVVIVPMGVALSVAEREVLAAHQQRGGAILASGPFGARDAAGEWTNWQLMQQLFGVQVTEEVPADSEARYLVTAGDGAPTHLLPAGSRIWLGGATESVLRFSGGRAAGWLYDWARTPPGNNPVLVYGDVKGARWALFGFSENAWDAQPTPMHTLMGSTLDWLQGTRKAYLANWPYGFHAAYLAEMDTEEGFEHARDFASMLEAVNIRGSFYVLTSVLAGSPSAVDALKALAGYHEIGYHGDVHEGFKGQAAAIQRQRLETMRRQLAAVDVGPIDAVGFRAPTESYDDTTEELLQEMGIRYHLADPNRSDARVPLLAGNGADAPDEALVVLPRTQRDDINLLPEGGSAADLAEVLKVDLAATVEQGALGILPIHSQHFAKGSALQQAMPPFLINLAGQRKEVWLATGREIAEWWRKRENLRVRLALHGGRQELELSYYGEEAVKGATVILLHPYKSKVSLSALKAWTPQWIIHPLDDFRSAVIFDEVDAGNYAYQVVFEQ